MVLGHTLRSLPQLQAWPAQASSSLAGASQGARWPPQSQVSGVARLRAPGTGSARGGKRTVRSESEPSSSPSCVVLGGSLRLPSSQVLTGRMGTLSCGHEGDSAQHTVGAL